MMKNHSVTNPRKSKKIIEKTKQTCFQRYGDENWNNQKQRKITCLKKYGITSVLADKEYMKLSILNKYGVENVSKLDWVKEKMKKTWINNYGVDHPSKDPKIHKKQQLSGFRAKKFKNTNIYYRGSYELDFLEKFNDKIDIKNAPSISYFMNNKIYNYFPDFYIPSMNLIVEIKSTWILNKQNKEKTKAKELATINNGFNYIMILDKDYSKLTFSKGNANCSSY